jgi:hypothetical protein
MKKYVVNKLDTAHFNTLITLLDYETQISDYLKIIKFPSLSDKKLLIDTALCSGINKYRFITTTLNNDGSINIDSYKYIDVDSHLLKIANEIIKKEPNSLNNSVLTVSQIDYINNK